MKFGFPEFVVEKVQFPEWFDEEARFVPYKMFLHRLGEEGLPARGRDVSY